MPAAVRSSPVHPCLAAEKQKSSQGLGETHHRKHQTHIRPGKVEQTHAPEGPQSPQQSDDDASDAPHDVPGEDQIGEPRVTRLAGVRRCRGKRLFRTLRRGQTFDDDDPEGDDRARGGAEQEPLPGREQSEDQRPQGEPQTPGARVHGRRTDDGPAAVRSETLHVNLEGGEEKGPENPRQHEPEELRIQPVEDQESQRYEGDPRGGADDDLVGIGRFDEITAQKGDRRIGQRPGGHGRAHDPSGHVGLGKTVGGDEEDAADDHIHQQREKINQNVSHDLAEILLTLPEDSASLSRIFLSNPRGALPGPHRPNRDKSRRAC